VILGTAGHIDHGKTALVRALTGVDTDRLPEERRRGITIELGFAPLVLDGVGTLGVVDVPGHEAFVRTMLAGATGIDLALLVVAADEGVMPQTREHLAILSLLGVRGGVIALTKRDLVSDADWLELVADDLRAAVAGTPLADAPVVPTSVVAGSGVAELKRAIGEAARRVPPRTSGDLFRMPVDRSFSVRGTGTVVTGTVWSGSVKRDDVVRVVPGDHAGRVRGVQTHGAAVDAAHPGARTAVALAGLEPGDVPRGSVLVSDSSWTPTRTLRAEVTLLDDAVGPLRPRTRVRFHLGTAEVGARIVAAGGPLEPGSRKGARVALDEPVIARAGDRFVLRSSTPVATIGGGTVLDPLPPSRRSRPWPVEADGEVARLRLLLAEAGPHGVERSALAVRLGVRPSDVDAVVAAAGAGVRAVGARYYAAAAADALAGRLMALLAETHAKAPLEPGVSLQMVRAQLAAAGELVEDTVRRLVGAGQIELEGGMVRQAGWAPRPSPGQEVLLARLDDALVAADREPPSVGELTAGLGAAVPALLRLLERRGRAVQVEPDRYYAAGAVERLVTSLRQGMEPNRIYSPAELRDVLGVSRKYLIPFLEFCDRRQITERRADGRVLAGPH
jgi:selenocysteine-specific elongation factor